MKKVRLVFSDGKGNLNPNRELTLEIPTDLHEQNIKTDAMDWDEDEDNAMIEYENLCTMSVDLAYENNFGRKGESLWSEFRNLTDEDKANDVVMCIEIFDRNQD